MGWGKEAHSTVKLLFEQLSVFILSHTTVERVDESSSSYSSFMQPVLWRTLQLPRYKLNTNGQSAIVFHFQKTHKHTRKTAFYCVNIKKINKYQPLCGLQHLSKCVSPSAIVPCLVCVFVCVYSQDILQAVYSWNTPPASSKNLPTRLCCVHGCWSDFGALQLPALPVWARVCGGCASPKKTHALLDHWKWFTDDIMFTLPELVWLH